MDLLWAQLISLLLLFTCMMVVFMLPYCVLSRKPSAFQGPKYAVGLSLANCLSAGVFLATFFVGLLPEVRHLFNEIQQETKFPLTETVIFSGFFLSLFTEQAALAYKERGAKITAKRQKFGQDGLSVVESPTIKESRFASSSSEPEDECDFEKGKAAEKVQNHHSHHLHHHDHEGEHHPGNGHHNHGHAHQHGHSHAAEWSNLLSAKESGFRLFILLVALGVHSIFEGLALGLQRNAQMLFSLFVGVAVHELLVAFALGVSVAKNRMSTAATVKLGVLFAASIPFGQVIGYIVAISGGQSSSGKLANAILQGLAAGTFIHVTFLEVIPSEFNDAEDGDDGEVTPHRFLKLLFLLLGFLLLLGCTVGLQYAMPNHVH